MGDFVSLMASSIAKRRTRKMVRRIEENNEALKNIIRYEPSDVEAFIERDAQVGSYIISGGDNRNRARAAASAVYCSLDQNIPVIVLHEGNTNLENSVASATSFTNNKVIIAKNSSVYDPFYNRTNQEICNLILNSCKSNLLIGAIGQQYITGIAEFIKTKNIPPHCDMFLSCPHDALFDKIDDALNQGYISNQKATQIRNQLMQGQTERANVQSFFSQLEYEGAGILSDKGNRNYAVNIRTAVAHNGMIMIDIGSSTNEILLNLIVNEIKDVLSCGKKIMLVLDNININANEMLSKVVKSLSARCLTTLLSDDVYAMLGADDNLFHTFVGNSSKCIVFSHSGISAAKWADVFGYYEMNKISENIGSNDNYQWGYGFGSANSINLTSSREFIVKPEDIVRMPLNEFYVLDRVFQELANTTMR